MSIARGCYWGGVCTESCIDFNYCNEPFPRSVRHRKRKEQLEEWRCNGWEWEENQTRNYAGLIGRLNEYGMQ